MAEKLNIGIDIGGTKVNIGLVDQSGNILFKKKVMTDSKKNPEDLIKQISSYTLEIIKDQNLTMDEIGFIGAGVPGTVDPSTGIISYLPNLSWYEVPCGNYFEEYLGRKVLIAQDSRNGALAEMLFGAGRGYTNLLCIAIGTGIGCGVIIDKKIYNGALNTAGELGHTPVVKGGRKCVCGNEGCLERYSSGTAILEGALQRYPKKFCDREKSCEAVFAMAYEGDKEILDFIDECVDYLAFGIANAISLFSPEAIIISGGLCEHKELYVDPIEEKMYKYGYFSWTHLHKTRVHQAILGSDAPMIGAAMLERGI